MAKKLSAMKDEEKDSLTEAYTTQGNKIEEQGDQPCGTLLDALGLCHDCKYCAVTEFEFKGAWVVCNYHERSLNMKDRIVRCNSYTKRGQMSLFDMQGLAWLIENDKKKVGFKI
jgi:hypothetical protein